MDRTKEKELAEKLRGETLFESMTLAELDELYSFAFNRKAYHLTRGGYIHFLYKERDRLAWLAENE